MQNVETKDSGPFLNGTIMPVFPECFDPKAKRPRNETCGKCGKKTSCKPLSAQLTLGGYTTRLVRCYACRKKALRLLTKLINEG